MDSALGENHALFADLGQYKTAGVSRNRRLRDLGKFCVGNDPIIGRIGNDRIQTRPEDDCRFGSPITQTFNVCHSERSREIFVAYLEVILRDVSTSLDMTRDADQAAETGGAVEGRRMS